MIPPLEIISNGPLVQVSEHVLTCVSLLRIRSMFLFDSCSCCASRCFFCLIRLGFHHRFCFDDPDFFFAAAAILSQELDENV